MLSFASTSIQVRALQRRAQVRCSATGSSPPEGERPNKTEGTVPLTRPKTKAPPTPNLFDPAATISRVLTRRRANCLIFWSS